MKIESIIPHYRNKEKVVILLDSGEKVVVSLETVYRKKLEKNKELSDEEFQSIALEENFRSAKSRALKYIERGDKTFKQIYDYLIRKEYSDHVIRKTLEFMSQHGFVDDERYAKGYVNSRKKKEGKSKIKYALKNKGISEDIIEKYLSGIDEEDIVEGIEKIVYKKIRTLIKSGKTTYEIKNKLYSYVSSKGFRGESVLKTINKAIMENEAEISENTIAEESNKDDAYDIGLKRYEKLVRNESNALKVKKKLFDFLMRKGYSYEKIKETYAEIKRSSEE